MILDSLNERDSECRVRRRRPRRWTLPCRSRTVSGGHLDHFLGIGQLMARFPGARPVASAAVVADINATVGDQEKQWQRRFGDDVDTTAVIPEPLDGNVIDLEGHELRVIEVPQGDISPSTVIHIPSIDTVIGGDVVYNRIHMMLALTGPAEWQKWIDSIDLVESLAATTIIAGHKQPDASDQDLDTILNGSRGYIRDFRDAVAASSAAGEVIEPMKAQIPRLRQPNHARVLRRRSVPRRVEGTEHAQLRPDQRHTDRRRRRVGDRRQPWLGPRPRRRTAPAWSNQGVRHLARIATATRPTGRSADPRR
ncbi:MAG: MBL fold metallo-hydrolase [Solirubrobacteraceae bacterium]